MIDQSQIVYLILGAVIGAITTLLLQGIPSIVSGYNRAHYIEKAYRKSLDFLLIEAGIGEEKRVFEKLPREIHVEISYIDKPALGLRVINRIRKFLKTIIGKNFVNIVIFANISYPEQVAFVIEKAVESTLSVDNVLDVELKRALIRYYTYKFVYLCKERFKKDILEIVERRFYEAKDKNLILKLDSKDLEEKITLNPPPEVKPLLDRVIVPMLEIKNSQMMNEKDLALIERVKAEMRKILEIIADEKIAVLFIGRRRPDDYLGYVCAKMRYFSGILVCSRGKYVEAYRKLIHGELIKMLEENGLLEEPIEKTFEGELVMEKREKILHCYVLLMDRSLLECR